VCNLLLNFLYYFNFNFSYVIRVFNLSVIPSLKSSIILIQKTQQPHPVLEQALRFISNIVFCWTLGGNTSSLVVIFFSAPRFRGISVIFSPYNVKYQIFCTYLDTFLLLFSIYTTFWTTPAIISPALDI